MAETDEVLMREAAERHLAQMSQLGHAKHHNEDFRIRMAKELF